MKNSMDKAELWLDFVSALSRLCLGCKGEKFPKHAINIHGRLSERDKRPDNRSLVPQIYDITSRFQATTSLQTQRIIADEPFVFHSMSKNFFPPSIHKLIFQ